MKVTHFKTKVWSNLKTRLKFKLLGILALSSFIALASVSLSLNNSTLISDSSASLALNCSVNISGTIFFDSNFDGANDLEDYGIEGIEVLAYDCDGNFVDSGMTDANGEYIIANTSIDQLYRVELDIASFESLALKPGPSGNDNLSNIRFETPGTCIDFGLVDPDACVENLVAAVCFARNNDPTTEPTIIFVNTNDARDWPGPANNNDNNGLWGIPSGSNAGNYPLTFLEAANVGEVNTTFGMDFDADNSRLITGSYMRAYSPMNTNASSNGFAEAALYQIPMDLPGGSASAPSLWLDLEVLLSDGVAGVYLPDNIYPGPTNYGRTGSNPNLIGYTGLGSIKVSQDRSELYVVNLDKRSVYVIPIGPNGEAPTSSSEIKEFSLPNTNCSGSWPDGRDLRAALGLGVHPESGRVYATLTCTGPTYDDVTGYIYSFDPSDESPSSSDFDLELTIPLNIIRPATSPNTGTFWAQIGHPWESVNANTVFYLNDPRVGGNIFNPIPNEKNTQHNQPWLGEVEFGKKTDGNYAMVVGERNRYHDLISSSWYVAGGVMYRACGSEGNWSISSGNTCSGDASIVNFSFTGSNAGVYTSPENRYMMYVGREGSMGSGMLTLPKGSPYVISPAMDNLFNSATSGITWLNFDDGGREKDIRILGNYAAGGFNNTNFTKANNWGAVAGMCLPNRIEIGNYVWLDSDGNGIQDACEEGIPDVTVELYDRDGTVLMGSTMTDADGQYYFNNDNVNLNGANGISPETEYMIKIPNATGVSQQSALDLLIVTALDAVADNIDSDGMTMGDMVIIEIMTGLAGCSDHTFDVGFQEYITCSSSVEEITCFDAVDGMITVTAEAANGEDLEYSINGADYFPNNVFSNLAPGNYTISVRLADDNAVEVSCGMLVISNPPEITLTLTDKDVTCGPVDDGGSIKVEAANATGDLQYDWSEDAYDGQSEVFNVPLGNYSITVTDENGCTAEGAVDITEEPCLPDPCENGELGGSVFNDNNANGEDEGNEENGFQGITVQLFKCDENGKNMLIETVYTDANGDYHFTDSSIDFESCVYQIVFTNLPDGYISSSVGPDNGTDVQIPTEMSCDYNYGILHPDLACTTPDFEASVVVGDELFSSGTLLGPGIALITCGTIVNLPADERHTVGLVDIKGITTAGDRPEVNPNGWYHPSWSVDNLGNVFGIDYDTTGNIYVTASSHYSHVYGYILGPDASNYTQSIIKYGDLGGGTDDLGAAGTVYKLDAVTGVASVFTQLPQQAFAFNHIACEAPDPPLARTTGPGLGNIVFDQANNQFFVSNFEDGKIYRLNTDGDTINSFDPQTLGVFAPDDGSSGWAPDAKPYGLAVNSDGSELYFGTHELNTAPGLYSVSLDTDGDFDGTEIFHAIYPAEGDIGYLFALEPGWVAISDLEFLPNGQIMVGLRTGCAGAYATSHNHGATFYIADEQGDGIFDNIISNPDISYPNDGTGNDDGYGGIGIWDKHDGTYDFLVSSSDTRTEEGPHGMILFPHNFTNGNAGFSLQPSAAIPYLPSFNVQDFKGIGGDVEVFSPCGEPPVHVGNFAWIDANGDGVQDACESPLTNLTVKLYTKPNSGDPELMATTTTDENGEYYFSDSMNVDQDWEASFAEIEKDSSYFILFCGDSYNPDGEIINVGGLLFSSTMANEETTPGGDMTDSDITNISVPTMGEFPGICITTDETDFTFDAGFIPKPDLALIQVLDPEYDISDLKFGDPVKFKITVFNQSLGSVDSLEITDYVPNGFTFDETFPGNELWSADGDNAEAVLSSGLAAGAKDSICIYLILEKSDDPLEWVNVAEISEAWSNGDPVEDCDSALNDDPDDNGGSEINTDADDEIEGDGTATEPGGDPLTDQDNVDPATVPICDLALINTIVEVPSTIRLGDTIKYAVIIENQGTVPATNIEIDYTIPNGLVYLDSNDDLIPTWGEGVDDATANISDIIGIGEKDTICIYLSVVNVPTDELTTESWTTFAEIASFEDPNDSGVDKSDVDSTPDGDPTNDPGGNPEDDTDDVITGDGTGDPEDPTEDSDPLLDEDDHDPAIIYVCDAATIIYTDIEEPIRYGDTIKFNIVVFNQGNGPITNIDLNDFLGDGLDFISTDINNAENWSGNNDQISTTVTEVIDPDESDTTCLELVVVDVIPYDEDAYLQIVEIEEFEDPEAPGNPKTDIDSTPDNDPENDSGGNPEDETDDEVDGDGTGDPEEPTEDSDPELDEDDNDPVLIYIFDLALDKVVQEDKTYSPGEKPIFEITVYNQGNVSANNFKIVDYLRDGFTFSTMNNPGWNEVGDNLVYTSNGALEPGESTIITLELTVVIPMVPMGVSDWWNYAEISEADDNANTGDPDPTDADSNPNDSETDDNMVEPDSEDDDVITENGLDGDDEDDHDPAKVIVGYDLALRKTVSPEGPYAYDDTLTYTITIFNQGGLAVSDIEIYDSIPCGFMYLEDVNDWDYANNIASTTLSDVLIPGAMTTKEIKLLVQRCDEPAYSNYLNVAEISDFFDENGDEPLTEDIDSTPNDDPNDDGDPIDDAVEDPMEEDDHDIEDIEICDLALINTISEIPSTIKVGDIVKYEVIVYNQGNTDANSTFIDYTIPNGLSYLPVNSTLSPMWISESDALASINTDKALAPGESDTLCLYLQIENVSSDDVTEDSWTTIAEITAFEDSENEVKTTDADSTPDDDPANDPGGNPDDETDNEIDGDGNGDPEVPEEDSDPELDEDDHDPAIVYVCDIAAIIDTEDEGPFSYGDTIKYFVEVHNQGNGPIANIDIQNLFGEGLMFVDNTENSTAGWIEEGTGELSLLITETLEAGDIDTICLYMEIVPDYESSEESWLNNVEVVSFEDPENPGDPKSDIDSTPDDDPTNDPGGNPNDEDTDDVTDGDGSGDPNDLDEDTNPDLDEDDQDVEDIEICDLALINTILEANDPPFAGDTIKYGVVIYNQGNTEANSVTIDYLIPNGLTYLPVNSSLDLAWDLDSPTQATVSTDKVLMPGESDTVCIYLQLENLPTEEATIDSWTTLAEISEFTDQDDETKTTDVDSSPDGDFTNDPGGNPDDDTDDVVDGDGTGDPTDPIEDGDPELDEDDHDPVKIDVCDVAINVEKVDLGPFKYQDVIKYNIILHNQGNGDITNINIEDIYEEGLSYLDLPINSNVGWAPVSDGILNLMVTDIIKPGTQDTVCLYLQIVPDHISSEESWVEAVKVKSFESPDDIGVPLKDVDNPPFAPPLEKDLEDLEDTKVFDLALIMQIDSMPPVLPVVPGDVLKFIVVVTNQGNTPANNIEITNYLMDENLALASTKENDGWDAIDSENNEYTIEEELLPAGKDTVCIYLEVLGGAMSEIVTFSEISGSTETDGDCYDIDSTPDDELVGDAGGTPESEEDDHIEDDGVDGNEDGITDEDDHDPAKLDAQDLALIIWADQKEPVLEGQDVKFIIRVTNQGNITNENIRIVDYLPEGFELSENDDNGWEYDEIEEDQVFKIIEEPLLMDSIVETCILLTVQEGVSATDLINYAEVVSSTDLEGLDLTDFDIDSSPNNIDDDDTGGQYEDMPDCTTDPIIINDDNYDEGAGVNGEDEDDHDPAWVHVFDLATIIYTDHTTPIIPGDEIKFNVEVHNQGNMSATDIDLVIHMPDGFTLSENDDNDWGIQDGILTGTYIDDLIPEQIDTICLLLEVMPDFMLFDLVPIVEISGAMDTLGNDRDESDLDSDPNESAEDDEGGEIFTDDDDFVDGNGEIDDDEDDHDPAVPPVMDLAIKIITVDEEPKMPGDIVKFSIMVYNQGSMIPSEFTIENYVPEGLIFVNNSDNNGWLPKGDTNATFVYDDPLLPLTSDTLCIFLEVAPGANPMNVVDMVEIIQIIDQMDNDVSLLDIDSESDDSNENDLGNDLYSLEDNKTDENGRSGEDEDDHDQAFVNMCQAMACQGHMNISVDQNCEAEISPKVVLTGDIFPDHVYEVTITNSDGEEVSNMFTGDDIGEEFTVSVSNPLCDDISCWLTILIEDKWAPQIICQNDTLSCTQAYDESTRPTLIDDNCSGGELILLDEILETYSCDSMFTSKLTRIWVAKDEAGNMSEECTQEITLLRTNLDSIMPVMNFMLATDNAINCSSGYETDANGHPAPSVTGVPKLRLENGSFLDLYPFEAMQICNGFVEYNDEVLQGSTSCVTKILRTWIVGEWWCSQTNQREFIQLIEVVDFEGPLVSCPSDLTISTSSFSCEGYTSLDLPSVGDACNDSNIRIDLSAPTSPTGFIQDYDEQIIMLPVGMNEITYHVYDNCGNRTDCSFFVTVRDDADPIAVCDQFTVVGIGLDDLTHVHAEDVDDGSFDECGPVDLAIARMDAPGFDDLIGFGPDIDITCEDVGNVVMVGLLVTDAGGNTNMCMVSIEVQDKVDAKFTCPGDMEVECNFPYDPDNLGGFFGEVVIYDNCPAANTVEDILLGDLNTCGSGVLTRQIRLLNAQGEQVDFCTQQITFRSGDQLEFSDITPPISEVTVTGCGVASIDPSVLGMPIVPDRECQQASIGIENDTFPFTQNGACLKIIRTFRVIDWCIDDGPGSIFEPFEFTQTIKVNNIIGPEIVDVFADSIFCSYEIGCGAININNYLTATSSDDCTATDDLLNRFEVRDSDGELVNSGYGLGASGLYDVDTYTVRFLSEDKCGNLTFEESTFEVRSCKLPTPYCLQGLSTTLTAMDTTGDGIADAEMVMIAASFFDAGSYHPCGYDVVVSFSADVNDTLRGFFCSDTIDLQPIELWATDSNGGQDYCSTFLDVQDNDTIDLCGGLKPVAIAGRIYTELDAELEEAEVELKSAESILTMTDEHGNYQFADMPQGGNYQVSPYKDNDHLNGVSTLDLVLIQRHILQIAPLSNAYMIVAADINNNEKISSSDLLALRKVILGIEVGFPNNTSWRFIDSEYEFVSENNPWETEIDEVYKIQDLSEDMQIDFIAVKTGDVNGDVSMNIVAGVASETRSNSTLTLEFPDISVQRDKLYEVEIRGTEALHIFGMQHSLDLNGLEMVDVIPGKMDLKREYTAEREGLLNVSYASANGDVIAQNDMLYTLIVKATDDGQLSEMIGLSEKGLAVESYHGEKLEKGAIEIAWREAEEGSPIELFSLERNSPNPWRNITEIEFHLPRKGKVALIVTDVTGKLIARKESNFEPGAQRIILTSSELPQAGVLFYELHFEDQVEKGKMIRIE